MDTCKLTLYYFNIAGKGEPIRLALNHAGIPFTDHRFKSRDEFIEMKESGRLQFGQVPALEVVSSSGGKETTSVLTQSGAIMRFISKLPHRLGSTLGLPDSHPGYALYPGLGSTSSVGEDAVAAKIDAIMDQEADAFAGVRVCKYKERFGFSADIVPQEVFDKVTQELNSSVVPRHLGALDRIMAGSSTGWIAGTAQPSIADFFWVPSLQALQRGWSGDENALAAFPRLEALVTQFMELESVQAWYAEKEGEGKH